MIDLTQSLTCTVCKCSKSPDNFWKSTTRVTGYAPSCKQCCADKRKQQRSGWKSWKKSTYVKRTCQNCGEEFDAFSHTKGTCCSKKCGGEYKTKQRKISLRKELDEGKHDGRRPSCVALIKEMVADEHGNQCCLCDQEPFHNGLPLSLQLDHIDGDPHNNRWDNLRLLCPNCHTQTDTYGFKNEKVRIKRGAKTDRRADK